MKGKYRNQHWQTKYSFQTITAVTKTVWDKYFVCLCVFRYLHLLLITMKLQRPHPKVIHEAE